MLVFISFLIFRHESVYHCLFSLISKLPRVAFIFSIKTFIVNEKYNTCNCISYAKSSKMYICISYILKNQCQKTVNSGKFRHRRKNSIEINGDIFQNKFNQNPTEDGQSNAGPGSPSTSLQIQDSAKTKLQTREEWAAIRIQTAFRGILVLY